jgi:hypothetical protein
MIEGRTNIISATRSKNEGTFLMSHLKVFRKIQRKKLRHEVKDRTKS